MIILPERGIARGKMLMPMRKRDWYQKLLGRDYGWYVQAVLNDGFVYWRGFFKDREDADEFINAIAYDRLKYERALWELPIPNWCPDCFPDGAIIQIFATTALTSTSVSDQTWSGIPADWSNNNSIWCIGAGGGGGGSVTGTRSAGGGGGGGAANVLNVTGLTAASKFHLEAGGAGGAAGGSSGGSPARTWISNTGAEPTSTTEGVLADSGNGGSGSAGSAGGSGGVAATNIGTTEYDGGTGGAGSANNAGGGGGGSAGNVGIGKNGGAAPLDDNAGGGGGSNGGSSTAGEAGNAGSDGGHGTGGSGGGVSPSGNGSSGGGGAGGNNPANENGGTGAKDTSFDATYGVSGGGGGSTRIAGAPGSANYGGGGGGAGQRGTGQDAGAAGGPALIWMSYVPRYHRFMLMLN